MLKSLLALSLMLVIGTYVHAGEPRKKPQREKIPAPKQVEPAYMIFPRAPRQDTMQVWEHFGVGPLGRFVPRVIVTPYGPLYSRALEPYPWMQNRTSAIMPYAID